MMQVAALIGDVVGSREAPDRRRLQDEVLAILDQVSARFPARLEVTLGDEFQARYPDLETAVAAAWYLHVCGLGTARFRVGIGWGELAVEGSESSPFGQDGPAWWRAREAIEAVAGSSHPARTVVRTASSWDMLINSYLLLRDSRLDGLDAVDGQILLGLAAGESQRALARRLDLHESSVSRRISKRLLAGLVAVATPEIPGFGS